MIDAGLQRSDDLHICARVTVSKCRGKRGRDAQFPAASEGTERGLSVVAIHEMAHLGELVLVEVWVLFKIHCMRGSLFTAGWLVLKKKKKHCYARVQFERPGRSLNEGEFFGSAVFAHLMLQYWLYIHIHT